MLKLVLLSALVATIPAFLAGMVALELPETRQLLEERVCDAGGTLELRITTINQHRTRMSYYCRYQDGSSSESVTLALLDQGFLLTWPPLTLVLALGWWLTSSLRHHRRSVRVKWPHTSTETTYFLDEHTLIERIVNSDEPDLRDVSTLLNALEERGQRARPKGEESVAETLRQLKALADQGLISRELHEAQAAELLNRHFGADLAASARRKDC